MADAAAGAARVNLCLVGHYRVPYPYSEHKLDYVLNRKLADQVSRLDCLLRSGQAESVTWSERNLHVHYAPRWANRLGALGFVLWSVQKLLKLNAQTAVDVVSGSDLLGAIAGICIRGRTGAKVVLQLQGEFLPPAKAAYPMWKRWALQAAARWAVRASDHIRCLYPSAAHRVAELRTALDDMTVIPSRCDIHSFDPARFPDVSVRLNSLVYVGRITRAKGVDVLIRAMAEVTQRAPNVRLTLIGEGAHMEQMRSLASSLGISEQIDFAGRVPHADLPGHLKRHSLFVFPSLTEATPRAVMEAMAMGLPVIATQVGGLPEMITPETGIVVPPGDAKALAGAITLALSRPEWMRQASFAGRKRAVQKYSLDAHLTAMLAMYASVAERVTAGAGR